MSLLLIHIYDFTTGASQAFGIGQASIGNGNYGLNGGDANSNGIIDISDKIQVWDLTTGFGGYYKGDINLDRQVENKDKNDFWIINLHLETQIPD